MERPDADPATNKVNKIDIMASRFMSQEMASRALPAFCPELNQLPIDPI
jgi:hypothetical protein